MSGIFVAVRAVYPKKQELLNLDVLTQEVDAAFREHGNIVKRELRKPVRSWKHRPTFKSKKYVTTKEIALVVYPYGDEDTLKRFYWVEEGTPPHFIKPKPSNKTGHLAFPSKYRPATRPNTLYGGTAKRYGKVITPTAVYHPGIAKPRHFFETVMREKRYPREWQKAMTKAIDTAIKKSRPFRQSSVR